MATRKRFYTAVMNDGSIRVLSLRFRPSPELPAFNTTTIVGPFKTLNGAIDQLERFAGVQYPEHLRSQAYLPYTKG